MSAYPRLFGGRLRTLAGATSALVASIGFAVQADLVVVQKMSGDMQNGSVTLKFKGSRVRTDLGAQVSSIADAVSGETFTLIHAKRTFVRGRFDPEAFRAQLAQDRKESGAESKPAKPAPSGQREKLGIRIVRYSVACGKVSGRYWVAAAHPMWAKVRAALEPVAGTGLQPVAGLGLPSPLDFPGLILKTELRFEKVKAVLEFVSARDEAIPAQLFEVPKEYREVSAGGNP